MSINVAAAVDDSANDLMLIEEAFKKANAGIQLKKFQKGDEFLHYVTGTGIYADRQKHPLPKLVLLDLQMAGVSGFEVLKRLGEIDAKPRPFVVVLSNTRLPAEIDRAHLLGANVVHSKPGEFDELCRLVQRFSEFFFPAYVSSTGSY